MLAAVLWDVDGTLAETERDGHRVAFNAAFEALGLPWHWDVARYGELLAVTGGRERLLHDMASRPDAPVREADRRALAQALHVRKNSHYAQLVGQGGTPLRPGVRALLEACRAVGLRQGIVTTTSRVNVHALLSQALGPHWPALFDCVVCGEDAARKKPDPLAYQIALDLLGLPAGAALALEDSPAGAAAAQQAGVAVAVTRSTYFAQAAFSGLVAVGGDLSAAQHWRSAAGAGPPGPVTPRLLRHWHASPPTVTHAG